ncbi:MAG: sensor histidine kinase [Prevotellaceae bacterium]|jgi:signal transduction histidine kinase|nr:sensor histidine kinase [Prevotellaceae bacterium]
MKKLILLCLTALLACNLKAQTTSVDSLINVLETQKLTNKEKIELYKEICFCYEKNNMDKLLEYAEKGLKLAKKENDNAAIINFYRFTGNGYTFKGKYGDALFYIEKALELSVKINDKRSQAILYGCISNVHTLQGNDTLALQYIYKCLSIFEDIDDKKNCVISLCNIGSIYSKLLNDTQALSYFERAKIIAEQINYDYGKELVYYNMADIHFNKKEFDTAIDYASKSLEISRKIKDKQGEMLSLQLLANYYCEGKKECDKGEKYALESLHVAEEYGEPRLIFTAWSILSTVYLHQGRYEECENLSLKAWEYDSSILENLSQESMNILNNLAKSYIYLGNKEKAADYFEKFKELITKQTDKQFQESIAEMEVKYETEKKEIRINALEKEKTLYAWIIAISIIAALLAFVILFFRHKLNLQKRRQAEQQVKQLEQEKRLVAAQALIDGEVAERSRLARDLHDGLGGMLSVVKLNLKDMKGYSILDNLDVDHFNKAMDMLDRSITELRRVAHHIMPESLMRYGLKVSLDDFCRAIPGASFRFFGDDANLDSRFKILIYRCAYELINNAVKHANATNINIQLMIENGLISLSVHDDGSGFNSEKITEGSGLENVRIRVASYNGKMNIYSPPDKGTEVSIEIELS